MSVPAPPRPPRVLRVAEPCPRPHAGSPDLVAVAALPPDRWVLDASRAESGAPRGPASGDPAVARAEELAVPLDVPVDDPGPRLPAILVGDERTDRLTRISDEGVRFEDSD